MGNGSQTHTQTENMESITISTMDGLSSEYGNSHDLNGLNVPNNDVDNSVSMIVNTGNEKIPKLSEYDDENGNVNVSMTSSVALDERHSLKALDENVNHDSLSMNINNGFRVST